MAYRYCRRRCLGQLIQWTISAAIVVLVAWTYRSWVVHGLKFLSSPEYRECMNRRSQYVARFADDKKNHRNLFVTMAHHGRLGNWLFQYASLLGIAKANGFTPYFPSWHSLNYDFELSNVRSTDAECLTVLEDPKQMSYVEKFNHLPLSNITLDGYFQSWKYFRSINDQIRKEFKFTGSMERILLKNFESYVGRHVRAGREIISIHVRRGDLLSSGAKRLGFKPAPAEYFANAMRYMVKRHPYSVFLIVSDDIEWCRMNIETVVIKYYLEMGENLRFDKSGRISASSIKPERIYVVNLSDGSEEPLHSSAKNIKKFIESSRDSRINQSNVISDGYKNTKNNLDLKDDNDFVYLRPPPFVIAPVASRIYDLGLLTLVNHSIMSTGSFGWWGAWLAGGEVVYYDGWPVEGHKVYYQWTRDDFYPPHWVGLSKGSRIVGVSCIYVIIYLLFITF